MPRTYMIKVIAYVDPVRDKPVDKATAWYQEKKIVETGPDYVIALRDGYRVRYKVQTYWFRDVSLHKVNSLFDHVRRNPKKKYKGWLHHANVYDGLTKQFFPPQIKIDHELN